MGATASPPEKIIRPEQAIYAQPRRRHFEMKKNPPPVYHLYLYPTLNPSSSSILRSTASTLSLSHSLYPAQTSTSCLSSTSHLSPLPFLPSFAFDYYLLSHLLFPILLLLDPLFVFTEGVLHLSLPLPKSSGLIFISQLFLNKNPVSFNRSSLFSQSPSILVS